MRVARFVSAASRVSMRTSATDMPSTNDSVSVHSGIQ